MNFKLKKEKGGYAFLADGIIFPSLMNMSEKNLKDMFTVISDELFAIEEKKRENERHLTSSEQKIMHRALTKSVKIIGEGIRVKKEI